MIKWFKNLINEWAERIAYGGYTYEEACQAAGGGGKGGGGSSARPVTNEEKRLWDSQAKNLDLMTKLAQEQFDLGQEDRAYYENIFRDGTDTEAKQAIAELKERITGVAVDPSTIKDVNVDELLRDTILNTTPEFQKAATEFIDSSNELTAKYGEEVSGLSKTFSQGFKDLSANYSQELQTIKEQTGTINQDVLSRETGASMAGISQSFAEARKQMNADLARRGLAGSGVEQQMLGNAYQQEALAKAQATTMARGTALQQSEAIRQQQAQYAGQQLQGSTSALQAGYQAEAGALQNIYGATTQTNYQNYQQNQAAQLQGIAGLTQLAQAGQGIYAGSANYLAGAGQTAGNAAQTAGSTMTSMINTRTTAQTAANAAQAEMTGALIGAAGGMATAGIISDIRLKTNIQFIGVENGHNIYTWDWKEGFDGGYNKGVIAQEVLTYAPEAISIDDSGYYRVDYSMLGLKHLVEGVA